MTKDRPESIEAVFTKSQTSKLNKLGIHNLFDLLIYFPTGYEDRTSITSITNLIPGTKCQIEGEIKSCDVTYIPRKNLSVLVEDKSGSIQIRFLNFYPSQIKQFQNGGLIRIYGEARQANLFYEFIHPDYSFIEADEPLLEHLTPKYALTSGISQKILEKNILKAIEHVKKHNLFNDLFPKLINKRKFPGFIESIENIHHPQKKLTDTLLDASLKDYRQRVVFDELLANQLFFRGNYHKKNQYQAAKISLNSDIHNKLLKQIGFKLTGQQEFCFKEIMNDLAKAKPMNRLLQGDVGSGKTIVATLAAFQVACQGYQIAFMAPTEILAEQHYKKLTDWAYDLNIKIDYLSGSLKASEKKNISQRIENGDTDVVVGTHALFQENVVFNNLAFYIIDEQHRFGVQQRALLRKKNLKDNSFAAHQLMMSATPIPRTLSMSYFADMDVSIINELPPGRQKISTKIFSESKRNEILETINHQCSLGNQVYWVCPLIDESEKLDLENAIQTHRNLVNYFSNWQVGLIHGKMKPSEKDEVMQAFIKGTTNILVATSVIEVGVDVPNANLMVIENSERLGLSQLHQLRGRIGRGDKKSSCVLLYGKKLSDLAKQRLKIIYETDDGFEIAEQDLKLRGPGEFIGLRQSGLPSLKISDLSRDMLVLEEVKKEADQLLLSNDPLIEKYLNRWLPNHQNIVKA